MADIQEIYSILLARSYQEELFSDLPGKRKREKGGRETVVDCPLCHKEGHFSYNRDNPVWKCWSCQEGGDWIHYLEKAKGYTFQQAKLELANKAGVETTPQEQANYKTYVKKADLLETAQAYFADRLILPEERSDKDLKVFQYLKARGYKEGEVLDMDLGAYTDKKALQEYLKKTGYTDQEIRDSGLLTIGEDWPLTFLWKDQAGRAIGIGGRSILSDIEPKYKYSAGLQKDQGLIGFSSVRGSAQIILVEGALDPLYLNFKGFKAVGAGGASLSADQLKALEAVGTKEILLAMDMDQAGQRATEKILRDLRTSKLRAYVASLPEGYKDPDELIRGAGSEAFQKALDQAERGSSWQAKRIMAKYDIATARGMDQALEEALDYYSDIRDPLEAKGFISSLEKATGLSEEDLEIRLKEASRTASTRRAQSILETNIRDIQQKASQGDITGAEADLARALREIKSSRGVKLPEPYLLEDLSEDIKSSSPSLDTGYKWLDSVAKIPTGALSIVAGRPGHGKTTFLLNLLVNMLRLYPEKRFYYFSYEESKKAIATKIIMIMAGVEIQRETNYGAYVYYLQEKRGTNGKIDQAIQEYEAITSSGRLLISDDMYPAEDLANVIDLLAKQGEAGAVFIDYIQRIPTPSQGQRYLDIKQISDLLLKQAVSLDMAIILGAQLGRGDKTIGSKVRLDNLRESGDIEQDANLVIGLYSKEVEELQEKESTITKRDAITDIQISILKNRGGVAGRSKDFSCNFSLYTITDKS
jgi:DNA primase catalytic core